MVQLRPSSEHILIVRASGAWDHAGVVPAPPLLNLRPSTDYPSGMELPHLKDDPYLKVLRPLVEAYLAFWRIDIRHIKSLRLTPSQFDVIATLGDTEGMTCSELSAQTFVPEPRIVMRIRRIALPFLAEAITQAQEQCASLVHFFAAQGPRKEWTKKGHVGCKSLSKDRLAFRS